MLLGCALLVSGCFASEQESESKAKVNEEIKQITKSLEVLIGELGQIKSEAFGRLSNVKNQATQAVSSSPTANPQEQRERIRQTKVSRFVLRRVAELESESKSMRDELNKLFELSTGYTSPSLYLAGPPKTKQEDHDFEDEQTTQVTRLTAPTTSRSSPATSEGLPASTTPAKPTADEAAQIGFDMEALKRLGEEIGKRLDQFGKEAAKNIGELIDGVKLVFRDPKGKQNSTQPAVIRAAAMSATTPMPRVTLVELAKPCTTKPSLL